MEKYLENYLHWLESDALTDSDREELISIKCDENEQRLRFTAPLSFGTAGLRGTMKVGLSNMNRYTVAHATWGLASLIKKQNRERDGVVIAYDSRNNSELFAKISASVLAEAGIKTYIFDSLRPTPELSFALRHLKCVAGINITASHNPKQYNGYKAYWEDGAQLPPEFADVVSQEINATDIFDVKLCDFDTAVKNGIITVIGKEIDDIYLENVMKQVVNPDAVPSVADKLKIVYTPLHGTGYKLVPKILKKIGLLHLATVDEQMVIDGNFPTVAKPNPEYKEVFELGINLADKIGSDLIIATDPDADRVGVMSRGKDGKFSVITGNQMGALLLDYIITAYENTNTMPNGPYAVKTIVTTELASEICKAHNVEMHNVLTGFKFIGEVIKNYEESGEDKTFLFGFEESYGYLKGTYARDKDAVVASMLICEMTAYYKSKNMTLMDALDALYARYGKFTETNVEVYMEGLDGAERMAALIEEYREHTPEYIAGHKVIKVGDYKKQTMTDLISGEVTPTGLPKTNAIEMRLDCGDIIIIRPSGTEPKIKYYLLLKSETPAEVYKKALN